jgi:hypothetical protein
MYCITSSLYRRFYSSDRVSENTVSGITYVVVGVHLCAEGYFILQQISVGPSYLHIYIYIYKIISGPRTEATSAVGQLQQLFDALSMMFLM